MLEVSLINHNCTDSHSCHLPTMLLWQRGSKAPSGFNSSKLHHQAKKRTKWWNQLWSRDPFVLLKWSRFLTVFSKNDFNNNLKGWHDNVRLHHGIPVSYDKMAHNYRLSGHIMSAILCCLRRQETGAPWNVKIHQYFVLAGFWSNKRTDSSSFSIPVGICGTARLIEAYSCRSGRSSQRKTGRGLEASSARARNDNLLIFIFRDAA